MKYQQKLSAIKLRKEGRSINSIAKQLSVAKSSVSLWTREVQLSNKQLERLMSNRYTSAAIEKRRQSRLKNEKAKRDLITYNAEKEISKITDRDLWAIGVSLYWAEGGKTQRLVRFSNGDPRMIKIMMRFFEQICLVNENKFRGHIHIHDHLDHKSAEQYWSEISGIPLKQFFKTYRRKAIRELDKKDSLPHGVMDIYVLDSKLFLKIMGWIDGICKHLLIPS